MRGAVMKWGDELRIDQTKEGSGDVTNDATQQDREHSDEALTLQIDREENCGQQGDDSSSPPG